METVDLLRCPAQGSVKDGRDLGSLGIRSVKRIYAEDEAIIDVERGALADDSSMARDSPVEGQRTPVHVLHRFDGELDPPGLGGDRCRHPPGRRSQMFRNDAYPGRSRSKCVATAHAKASRAA